VPAGALLLAVALTLLGEPAPQAAAVGVDLDGRVVDPLSDGTARVTVLLFTRADCPISNRYAPEVRRLHDLFAPQGVRFWLVYPDPAAKPDGIRTHLRDYDYPMDALRDPEHALVRATGARVTPEAAVFVQGRLVYHGRIDDRFPDFGKARAEPSSRDLEAALEATLDGRDPPVATAPAVGCYLSDIAPR
jgi:hypothetical protein